MSTEVMSVHPRPPMSLRSVGRTITSLALILVVGIILWLAIQFFTETVSVLAAIPPAVVSTAALTLLVLGVVALALRQWQNATETPYWQLFLYVFRVYLWPGSWSLVVDDGDLQGLARDKNLYEIFGGPGWLFIYPDHIVVLHKRGTLTRIETDGWVELKPNERIKAIVPLGIQRHVFIRRRFLTRDRIYLDLEMNYLVEVEKAADTLYRLRRARDEARTEYALCLQTGYSRADVKAAADKYQDARHALAELGRDRIFGEGDDTYYESIIRTVAGKAPNLKVSQETPLEMALRDVIMTQTSDDMVFVNEKRSLSLAERVEQRRIYEIEQMIQTKVAGDQLKRGLVLKSFDITNVTYPEDIKPEINKEISAVIEARIQQLGNRATVEKAEANATAKVLQANAERKAAKSKAMAKYILNSEKTARYKKLVEGLRASGLPQSTIRDVLINMTSSEAVEVKLNQILELTNQYLQEKDNPDS